MLRKLRQSLKNIIANCLISRLKNKSSRKIDIYFDKRILDVSGDILRFHVTSKDLEHLNFQVRTKRLKDIATKVIDLGIDEAGRHHFSATLPPNTMRDLIVTASISETKEQAHKLITIADQKHKIDVFIHETISADYDGRYMHFLDENRPSDKELQAQRQQDFKCSFSIIIPLYHTPVDFLKEAIDSVLAQSFQDWELLLIRAKDESQELFKLTDDYARDDQRIRIVDIEKNLGITETTNFGLDAATKEFVCFMDHDDLIEPNLLYEYAKAIDKDDEIDILCCNEDQLLQDGICKYVMMKPDKLDLNMLISGNYVCHMLTVRKSLVDSLSRPTREVDGAQDFHMTLRCLEKGRKLHNVPKTLYHWRVSETSTASNPDDKPFAIYAGQHSVSEHFKRTGIDANVQEYPDMHFLYIPNYQLSKDARIETVDTGADLAKFKALIANSTAEYLFCINNCNEPDLSTKEQLAGYLEQNGSIIAACPKIIFKDGLVKSIGYVLGEESLHPVFTDLPANHHGFMIKGKRDHSVFCADENCVVVRRSELCNFLNSNYILFVKESEPTDLLVNFMLNRDSNQDIVVCPYLEVITNDAPCIDYKQFAIKLQNRELLPEFDMHVGSLLKRTNGYMQLPYD